MATYSGDPHVRTVKSVSPSGKETVIKTNILSKWADTKSKVVAELPAFTPGKFLIKPYEVSSTQLVSNTPHELRSTYKRYDGTSFTDIISVSRHIRDAAHNGIPWSPPSTTAQEGLAMQEALAKLNEAQWDALVDLAEIGGTFDLIKDGLKALSSPKYLPQLLRSLPKWAKKNDTPMKKLRGIGKKGSEGAANADLTYRYGVMPLILSIQDALELLRKQLAKAGNQIRTARRRPAIPSVRRSYKHTVSTSASYETEWTVRIEAIVYYKRTLDQTLQSALGFVPENVPAALWELVTLSFVADWFFNIGSFLNALKPKVGVEVLGTSVSVKKEGVINVTQYFPTTDVSVLLASKPYTYKVNSFKRTTNPAGVLTPAFTGLDGYTLPRMADSVALALKPTLKALNGYKKR